MAAADEPAIEALVADSPYADAADLIVNEVDVRTDVPRWIIPLFVPGSKLIAGAFFGIDVGKLTPEEAAARIEYPILVLHGEADTRIPPDHGRRVRDAAHPRQRILAGSRGRTRGRVRDLSRRVREAGCRIFRGAARRTLAL